MGGVRSPQCNEIAKQIWVWCIERNIWLIAAHILAGVKIVEVDRASIVFNDLTEWEMGSSLAYPEKYLGVVKMINQLLVQY